MPTVAAVVLPPSVTYTDADVSRWETQRVREQEYAAARTSAAEERGLPKEYRVMHVGGRVGTYESRQAYARERRLWEGPDGRLHDLALVWEDADVARMVKFAQDRSSHA